MWKVGGWVGEVTSTCCGAGASTRLSAWRAAALLPTRPLHRPACAPHCLHAGIKRAVAEHRPKVVFLTSPNNPDGSVMTAAEVLEVLALPVLVVLDEAYVEFAEEPSLMPWVAAHPNLVVLRTFSKCAALAGLRCARGAGGGVERGGGRDSDDGQAARHGESSCRRDVLLLLLLLLRDGKRESSTGPSPPPLCLSPSHKPHRSRGMHRRVGYGAFPLGLIQYLWRAKQPYNVSVAAEVAAVAALSNLPYMERVRDALVAERQRLLQGLAAVPYLEPSPSHANFVLCRVAAGRDARALRDALAQRYGIMVRHYATAELSNYVRVSVGLPEHTDRLLAALAELGGEEEK